MKAVWIIFVILLPYLGVFIYLIAEHNGMADRSMEQMQPAKAQQDEYIKSVAGQSAADQIAQAKQLLDSGAITPGRVRRDQGEGTRLDKQSLGLGCAVRRATQPAPSLRGRDHQGRRNPPRFTMSSPQTRAGSKACRYRLALMLRGPRRRCTRSRFRIARAHPHEPGFRRLLTARRARRCTSER